MTVFTVGHGARPLSELLDLLRRAGIERLVDVRTVPGSRRHPQFGQDRLASSLEEAGVEYVWRKDLGGFRTPRPDSRHVALENPSFRGYADHMDTPEFAEALGWLVAEAAERPAAIMCAESVWWRCHRRMVADALVAQGCRAVHLLSLGRRDEHRLSPMARIEGGRPVYDVAAPTQPPLPVD